MSAAERRRDRHRETLGEAGERRTGASDQRLPPARTIGDFAAQRSFCSFAMSARPGQVSTGSNAGASGTATRSTSMSSGNAMTTGRVGRCRRCRRRATRSRECARIVDLGRPFRHRAEHGAVVELLECLALAHLARDLADEHDERRGVLLGDVDAGRGIGGARPAGAEHHARPAGDLADRLRHHGGAALLPADREIDRPVVEGVERGEIALARHAEYVLHAVHDELVDQNFAAGAGAVIGAHILSPEI